MPSTLYAWTISSGILATQLTCYAVFNRVYFNLKTAIYNLFLIKKSAFFLMHNPADSRQSISQRSAGIRDSPSPMPPR